VKRFSGGEYLADPNAPARPRGAARGLIIEHLEETRIGCNVLCPQLLHHGLHLMKKILFAIRE
jgi:hypothetical protein